MDQSSQKPNPDAPSVGAAPSRISESDQMNVGEVVDIDGQHSEFAPANAGYTMHSSSTAETSKPAKPPLKARIVHEVKEVGLVMGYLAISFCIIQTFRCATILQKCSENDFLTSYGTACLGAVVLGKFVFVLEKMRISKRFEHKPLIYAVLYKTALFSVLVNVLMHFEDRFLHKASHSNDPTVSASTDPTTFLLCFFAHQLAFVVTFFIFFVIRDIARVLGKGRLFRMFFVSIE